MGLEMEMRDTSERERREKDYVRNLIFQMSY
jgi:hypothetical protein